MRPAFKSEIDTSWMKPGTGVWYKIGKTEYAGDIDGDLFPCGCGGRPVARLKNMDEDYVRMFKRYVHSIAELKFLRPRS